MLDISLEGVDVFGRRKQQQAMQQAERTAATQILQTVSDITFPGDAITPHGVEQAAQMVGMQVVQAAVEGGESARDCAAMMSMYVRVGQRTAVTFAPGGPMHGATSADVERILP